VPASCETMPDSESPDRGIAGLAQAGQAKASVATSQRAKANTVNFMSGKITSYGRNPTEESAILLHFTFLKRAFLYAADFHRGL